MQQVNLGMIGGGTVGSGVFHAWQKNGGLMAARLGVKLVFRKIAVKAFDEPRPYPIPRSLMTTDWQEVVNDPQIQVVIELVGGTGIARTMILAALKLGKPVITANKALLSAHGEELFAAAKKYGANLYYEASVCGGIPIIKSLREGFVGNRINALYGIVNGTCNYILTRMKLEGADFAAVLAEAQKLGYAETPPDLDIDGHDAAHKTGILASLAHGFWVNPGKIHVEGIRHVSAMDIKFAGELGYTIKLLGIVKRIADCRLPIADSQNRKSKIVNHKCRVQVSVYPTLIPNAHVLASVNHVFNAVFVRGDVVGDTLFYGRGAGKDATASAVLSDVADAALDLKSGVKHRVPPFVPHECSGRGRADCRGRFAVFCPARCRGQARHAGKNRGHFRPVEHRHFVRHPARRPRRQKRAADFHAALRPQRRGDPGARQNRQTAGHQRQARHAARGKF